jgi:DNA-binding Xre family transcriptional regulator
VSQSAQLKQAVKRVLKTRGMSYRVLARELRLSEVSVKRMLAGGTLTLQRLEKICAVLDLDFFELAKYCRQEETANRELGLEQEEILARDPKLLTLFHLLLNDWTVRDILADYDITEAEVVRLLVQLDRLKLIDLLPGNRVRLRCGRPLAWRAGGPVRRSLEKHIVQGVLAAARSPGEAWLEVKELSEASLRLMRSRIQRLSIEADDLAQADAALPNSERLSVGIACVCRPWTLPTTELRKKR